MADKVYQRETAGAVASPINLLTVEGKAADWIQTVAGGALTFKDGGGASVTYASTNAGDVLRGPFREITSSAGKLRYGTGEGPSPSVLAASGDAAASATAAATSATAAATSATAAATAETNAETAQAAAEAAATAAATSATAAATAAAGYALTPSASVITADPAPAVIGTLYVCNPSGGAFNVALPAINAGNHGKRIGFTVSTTSGNNVTPVPNGTDELPGGFTSVAGAYGYATLQADNGPTPKVWRRVG